MRVFRFVSSLQDSMVKILDIAILTKDLIIAKVNEQKCVLRARDAEEDGGDESIFESASAAAKEAKVAADQLLKRIIGDL